MTTTKQKATRDFSITSVIGIGSKALIAATAVFLVCSSSASAAVIVSSGDSITAPKNWLPRQDFIGGPCIMEADLEIAFSKGGRLPRTCIEKPCEDLMSIEELGRTIYGRDPTHDEVNRYDTSWVHHCMTMAQDEGWGPIDYYALDTSGLGQISDMVTFGEYQSPFRAIDWDDNQLNRWQPRYVPITFDMRNATPAGTAPRGGLVPSEFPLDPPDPEDEPKIPQVSAVDVPSAGLLLGTAMLGVLAAARRKRQSRS